MHLSYDHLSPAAAVTLQRALQSQYITTPLPAPPKKIGGADISFNKYSERVYAGIIVLSYPELKVIERSTVAVDVKFPYISGLLAFREMPAIMQAFQQLAVKPDVLILDGHGTAHPRGMGIATHFGIVAGVSTIGCGKSRLTGTYTEPGPAPGDTSDLILRGEKIGEVMRTKGRCNPVFVSPGHLITQEESSQIIRQCITTYRIPEPTRLAHLLVNEVRVAAKQ